MKFEIFIDKPTKIEVEAESYEQAIQIIKQQFKIDEGSPVTFSQPIEVEID